MTQPQPRAQKEVVEELRESLEVLPLDRTPRPEKMAREQALLHDAHEVHFTLRRVATRDAIEKVREGVDKLVVARRELPEARPPPPPPVLAPEPEPEAPQAKLTPEERKALERVVPGKILRVDPLYRTAAGQAVEVTFEKDGARRTEAYVVRGKEAATVEELGRVLDEIPVPTMLAPDEAAPTASAPSPEAAPEAATPVPKKGFFGKKDKPDAAKEQPAAPAESKSDKKRRFGLGKK